MEQIVIINRRPIQKRTVAITIMCIKDTTTFKQEISHNLSSVMNKTGGVDVTVTQVPGFWHWKLN